MTTNIEWDWGHDEPAPSQSGGWYVLCLSAKNGAFVSGLASSSMAGGSWVIGVNEMIVLDDRAEAEKMASLAKKKWGTSYDFIVTSDPQRYVR